jgi:hypothetical protein
MRAPSPVARLVILSSLGLGPIAWAGPQGQTPAVEEGPAVSSALGPSAIPAEYLREERGGLRFAYHPSARDAVRPLLEQAESLRDEIRRALGADVLGSVDVRIAWGPTDLSRHGTSPGREPASAARAPRLAIDLESAARESSDRALELFRREMAVVGLGELAGAGSLPTWLATGFGASFAGAPGLRERFGLGWALSHDSLIPVQGLDVALGRGGADAALGAAEAADWVGFLRTQAGSSALADLVRRLGTGQSVGNAMEASFGASPTELEARWRADLARRAVFVPLFLGGLLVAALVLGALAWWRRIRRRRALRREELLRLRERARAEAERLVPVHVRLVKLEPDETPLAAALHFGAREERSDPDVPKIAHDGQWHTLH